MLKGSIFKNSATLSIFAIATAAILALTYLQTKDKIAVAERLAAQAALLDILPATTHDNDLLNDTSTTSKFLQKKLNLAEPSAIHIARNNEKPEAIIVPSVATDGYSGDINMLIGIYSDGKIAGVRVLSHKETPGLGDKIDLNKDDWILSFNQKSLTSPEEKQWTVKKDGGYFDQFTGATITPRAVVQQVAKTLKAVQEHHSEIFAEAIRGEQTETVTTKTH